MCELEHSELAVVPLVVGAFGGEGAADAVDGEDRPPGGAEAAEGWRGEGGGVGEEDEVFGGVGAADALRQGDGAAHVGFRRVEDSGVGVSWTAAVVVCGVVALNGFDVWHKESPSLFACSNENKFLNK